MYISESKQSASCHVISSHTYRREMQEVLFNQKLSKFWKKKRNFRNVYIDNCTNTEHSNTQFWQNILVLLIKASRKKVQVIYLSLNAIFLVCK